jgi:ariadne-1
MYLEHQVKDGPLCVYAHCPEFQCKQAMTRNAFETLCSPPVYEKYLMYLTRNFIETSSYMRWCPSPGCERVAIGSGITTVRCLCNFPFCFRCGQEAHDPSTCAQLATWQEKCQNESETANWILANTKKCPKCQTRIEKNQGCNHMSCKMCKHEFCWICMGAWSEHGQNTGGFYKCNKYDPNATDSTVEKAKAELDRSIFFLCISLKCSFRYLHYYQRYHGHDSALAFASKQREFAEKRMVDLQQSERSSWVDVQFLKQAVEQVKPQQDSSYLENLGH